MIYFVRAGNGAIKIGYASDPERRIYEMQTSQPEKIRLLGVLPGDQKAEREMHRKFSRLHIRGEWFRPEDELLAFIETMTTPHPIKKRFDRVLDWQPASWEARKAAWGGSPVYSKRGYGERRFTSRSPRPAGTP